MIVQGLGPHRLDKLYRMAGSLGHQEAESLRRDVGIEETGSDPACAAVCEDVSPIPEYLTRDDSVQTFSR